MKAFHGGQAWQAVGEDFQTLDKFKDVVNADVLDAWFDPAPNIIKKLKKHLPTLIKTAPPTHAGGLVQKISEARQISEKNIGVSGGSSDIMFVLFQAILSKEDRVLILDPMYGEYAHIFENILNTKLIRHDLSKEHNFEIETEKLKKQIDSDNPKIVALVNPNSPTGQCLSKEGMLDVVQNFPNTIFVIDETYVEYVGEDFSLEKEAATLTNLIIIKSMSKVYALSGARVGYFVAPEPLIEKVNNFIPPWSVGSVGQFAGIEALNNPKYYKGKYKETHALRQKMISNLSVFSDKFKVYDSCANFFLVELLSPDLNAEAVVSALRERGVYLRNCDSMSVQFQGKFIRVAVKSRQQNQRIIRELVRLLK